MKLLDFQPNKQMGVKRLIKKTDNIFKKSHLTNFVIESCRESLEEEQHSLPSQAV